MITTSQLKSESEGLTWHQIIHVHAIFYCILGGSNYYLSSEKNDPNISVSTILWSQSIFVQRP